MHERDRRVVRQGKLRDALQDAVGDRREVEKDEQRPQSRRRRGRLALELPGFYVLGHGALRWDGDEDERVTTTPPKGASEVRARARAAGWNAYFGSAHLAARVTPVSEKSVASRFWLIRHVLQS